MKYYIQLGVVLFLIAAVASGILAFVNNFTEPIIEENMKRTEEEARREVLPDAVSFEAATGNFAYYFGYNDANELVGYCFIATGAGYSGDVATMVGVNTDFSIANIKIVSQSETPGLGANCVLPRFTEQFGSKSAANLVLDKDNGEIQSITGATITTRTIVNSIKEDIILLEKTIKEDELEEAI